MQNREIVRLPKVNIRHAMPESRQSMEPAASQPTEQSPRRTHLRLVRGRSGAVPTISESDHILSAPAQLTSATRVEFRRQALAVLEAASLAQDSSITIDLAATSDVDASGLGILVLVQKKAKDAGLATRLVRVTPSVKHLLVLTKLDHLFDLVD